MRSAARSSGSAERLIRPPLNIVLVEPEIPWNTGNIGRTCIATGTRLHLVGRLGFSLDAKQVRRSGLDYWPKIDLYQHRDWDAFMGTVADDAPLFLFSTKGKNDLWEAEFRPGGYLVFGRETAGLPAALLKRFPGRVYRIPMMSGDVRSLNLSTAAAVALYEALRQLA